MNEEQIIYSIEEELLQSAAEANLGRELTETELKRLPCVFTDKSEFFDGIYGALICAAEDAMNNKDGKWKQWDKDFKDRPRLRM
jgi:hypothetical protein